MVAAAVAGPAPGPGLSPLIVGWDVHSHFLNEVGGEIIHHHKVYAMHWLVLFSWILFSSRFVIFRVLQVKVQPPEVPQVSYSLEVPLKVRVPCHRSI